MCLFILLNPTDRCPIGLSRRHACEVDIHRFVIILGALDPFQCVVSTTLHQDPAPETVAQRVAIWREWRPKLAQAGRPAFAVLHLGCGELQQHIAPYLGGFAFGQRTVDPGAGLFALPGVLQSSNERCRIAACHVSLLSAAR
jgi:hypothetical protein